MKKHYIYFLAILPLAASSQITIVQSDLPVVGTYYINAVDSGYSAAITPGGTGPWNYSSLQNIEQDTLGFIAASLTPYASSFPAANLAGYDASGNAYAYFISDATGFYVNGAVSPGIFNGIPLVYNPAQMLVPVPFTYNNTASNYYRFIYSDTATYMGNTDSVRFVLHGDQTFLADGYGSLTTPASTYPNTLRIKTTILESDTFQVKFPFIGWTTISATQSQSTVFRWVQNGNGSLILELNADSLGQNATSSSYVLASGVVDINDISDRPQDNVTIYPNPASSILSFKFYKTTSAGTVLTIYNTHGEIAEIYDVSRLNSFTTTAHHLPNGMYFYSLDAANSRVAKGKFSIKK